MYTDPIADLLTRIRNGLNAHHESVSVPHSVMKENILKVLKSKGFIKEFKVSEKGAHKNIEIILDEEKKGITIKRISSPGQRIYVKSRDLKPVKSGLGIRVISTPKGVMSNVEASKQKLGGEIICEVY